MLDNPLAQMGVAAKEASYEIAQKTTAQKNALLYDLANALERAANGICAANELDVSDGRRAGMGKALLDRLVLTQDRLQGVTGDIRAVANLSDPVGEIIDGKQHELGLTIMRRRVPLGVVAVIYEARPNVTMDVASLCLKTGNAVILRGGKETRRTNEALLNVIQNVLERHQLPKATVQAITDPDRELVEALLCLDDYVDILIPRGGPALQQLCKERSRIPVITGGIGVCHIFLDEQAQMEKSLQVIENAKVQRPSVCNSLETLLVHAGIADAFLPALVERLGKAGVTFHTTDAAQPYFTRHGLPCSPVTEEELHREWLTLDMNVHVVKGLEEAISHIRRYSSGHSDAILTESMHRAARFVQAVDSAAVYVNASTRFTDGGQFGLGAEIAVSTQKLHARGPLGLKALTTYKWVCEGDYCLRA